MSHTPMTHLRARSQNHADPLCGEGGWHYITSPWWKDVRCMRCNTIIREGSDNNHIDNKAARIQEEWRNRK